MLRMLAARYLNDNQTSNSQPQGRTLRFVSVLDLRLTKRRRTLLALVAGSFDVIGFASSLGW